MANPVLIARTAAQTRWPGAVVVERGRGHIKHRHPTDPTQFMFDTQVGGIGWHYGPLLDQEVDTAWEPAVAPWQYKMVKAEYNAYLLSRLDAGMVGRYTDPNTGEYVEFDPQNLQWTNDLNQIQPIGVPQNVNAVISDDLATWPNGYGPGRHFSWQAQTARFEKLLTIDSLASLPTPEPFIRSGGNPALELQLTFRRSAGVGIWVNGTRWDTGGHADRATSGLVEFRLITTGQVLWWFNLPRSWDSIGEQVIGTFWFKRQGQSLNVFHRIPLSWIEDPTRVWPIMVDITVDKQVGASADDCYRYGASTLNLVSSSPYWCHAAVDMGWGGRWTGITIPAGSTINVAYALWTARATAGNPSHTSTIYFDDEDDAATFSTYGDFDGRPRTMASVNYVVPAVTVDVEYQTSSLVAPVQEVIDRAGWANGNALALLKNKEPVAAAGIYGYSWDVDLTKAAKLHIEYTAVVTAIKTINDLAKASVKQVNGLATASVKTWDGLA